MNQAAAPSPPDRDLAAFLSRRLTDFVRHARAHDFRIGVAEELDAHRVALITGLDDPVRLRWGLRALLCTDGDDWRRFDELFDRFWRHPNMTGAVETRHGAPIERRASAGAGVRHRSEAAREFELADGSGGEVSEQGDGGQNGASDAEALSRADFAMLADQGQMRVVERLVERLARKMRRRALRRQRLARRGHQIDLRGTVRKSLRYGGLPLQLVCRQRRRRQPRLVLIVDVSRSMALYSTVFLRFARGIVNAFGDSAAFAYHTRLVPITEALRQSDPARLRASLTLISRGWLGGTRIGECLMQFNDDYGRLLNSRTVVVIVSDGLDTGEPSRLTDALSRIKRRSRRLVWLSPLLGRPDYEPRTRSLQAALPLLDLFAPAHNMESLAALEPTLSGL